MVDELMQFFECRQDTPKGKKSSVHYGFTDRLDKAAEQASLSPVDVSVIISYVNEFLMQLGMDGVKDPIMYQPEEIDYSEIKNDYMLRDERDIIWMKFTKDGYLGVVAASNDINFKIPSDASDYNNWHIEYNQFKHKDEQVWDYNTAGILVHQLGKEWDRSFVLVFPLTNIPDGYVRGDIERAIGNFLTDKGVPILDFYSHRYCSPHNYGYKKPEFEEKSVDFVEETMNDWYPNENYEDGLECWDGIDY